MSILLRGATSGNLAEVDASGHAKVSAVITNPTAEAAGIYSSVSPFGQLNVSTDNPPYFSDVFDSPTVDTTNRWTSYGSVAATVVNNSLAVNPSTTANATVALQSQPYLPSVSPVTFGCLATLETGTIATGNHRFFGYGATTAQPGTSAAPLTDAIGFEIDTSGVLRASVYQAGTRVFTQALTIPTDGAQHRYAVVTRADVSFWFMDQFDVPIANSMVGTNVQSLPVRVHSLNSAAVTGTPAMSVGGVVVYDEARQAMGISDCNFPWRRAFVGKSGGLSVKGAWVAGTSASIGVGATGTIGPLDVTEAGVVTFIVKNTTAGSGFTGNPVLFFEQSDDSVSWGPLIVARSDTGVANNTYTLGTNAANTSLMFDAGVEGVGYVRCRVTVGPATNPMTVMIQPGGLAFTPVVTTLPSNPGWVNGNGPTSVAAAAVDTQLLVANALRKGAAVYNDSTAALYLSLGTNAASTTAFTIKIAAGGYYEVPAGYTGMVRGIWATATGSARITEIQP